MLTHSQWISMMCCLLCAASVYSIDCNYCMYRIYPIIPVIEFKRFVATVHCSRQSVCRTLFPMCGPAVGGLTWCSPPLSTAAVLLWISRIFRTGDALIVCALTDLSWGGSSLYFLSQSRSAGTEDLVNTISHGKQAHMQTRWQPTYQTSKNIYKKWGGRGGRG